MHDNLVVRNYYMSEESHNHISAQLHIVYRSHKFKLTSDILVFTEEKRVTLYYKCHETGHVSRLFNSSCNIGAILFPNNNNN